MKSKDDIERMIGTCGTSPAVDNIERILEVCQELLWQNARLESRVKELENNVYLS